MPFFGSSLFFAFLSHAVFCSRGFGFLKLQRQPTTLLKEKNTQAQEMSCSEEWVTQVYGNV